MAYDRPKLPAPALFPTVLPMPELLKTRCRCSMPNPRQDAAWDLRVQQCRVPRSEQGVECTPLFVQEMRKVFRRAKLLSETYPGIKLETHILAPCGSLYCVRSDSAESHAHVHGPILGASRRLRQIVKDSKSMLELFPSCRISIKASTVAQSAPFDFSYTNFLPHEFTAFGIASEQPAFGLTPVLVEPGETAYDGACQEDSPVSTETAAASPTMLMRFGTDKRVRLLEFFSHGD